MLGVCCHWVEEKVKPRSKAIEVVNLMNEKSLQLGRFRAGKYSEKDIRGIYINNVSNLKKMLPLIRKSGIKLFRISSSLFPLSDVVPKEYWDNDIIKKNLREIGDFVKKERMRVTTHPGQFCVLSSDSDNVVENSNKELLMHAWMFDQMGLDQTPFYAINIHGGKKNRSSLLVDRILSLPQNVRKRLTLENDENCYSHRELIEVSKKTSVPIVFDSHHFTFNDHSESFESAFFSTMETWSKNITPLQHISNTEPEYQNSSFTQKRKHSKLIHYVPDLQLKFLRENLIDVDVEAKLKNISVFKMSKDFNIPP